jgi:O-acetylserine/cysteine efflux transporter
MTTPHLPFRDLALVLVICVVWAGNFIAGAQGMAHFSPLLFMVLRFAVVLAVALPFLRPPPRGEWLRLIGVCLSMGTLHFTLLFWALGHSVDISSVAIVQQTYIPMAVVLAMLLLREHSGWKTLTAVGVAFLGVLVVGFDPVVLGQPVVLLVTLLSALFQALGSIYQRSIRGVGVLSFQAWTAVISLPLLVAASLAWEQGQGQMLRTAEWTHWASVLYSALLASLIGHGLFFFLVQRHPVSSIMPYLQLTPVLGVVFGILVWGDRPGWRLLAGGTLVIFGILFITLRARQRLLQPGRRRGNHV